jgi:penicillin amidase
MVVAGERSATGLPLLANDPHLAPAQPSIWYQMALHCRTVSPACPYTVTGYSFSGLPGIVIGHNARIAWGLTNLGPDVADLVLERVAGDRYEYMGRMVDLDVREDTIRVAGDDDVPITIRATRHGPLLSDAIGSLSTVAERAPAGQDLTDLAVALRWTALRPGTTFDALPALNSAADFDDFRAAAALFEVPAQNLVYADVDGTIGYQAPGRIPLRAAGDDGRWPVPGWTGEFEWQGAVAFEDLPWVRDPPEGFIVTANQPVIVDGSGPFLSRDHAYGWRSQRMRDLLADAADLTVDDLLDIQFDARNGLAATLVPLLADIDVPGDVVTARDLLTEWDQQQTVDSAAGAYFAAVWRHLLLRTFADDLPADTVISGGGRWMEIVRRQVAVPAASWWDDRSTAAVERRDDMLRAALVDAHRESSDRLGSEPAAWQWGQLHTLILRHPTLGASGVGPIERLFNRGPVAVGGGPSIVDATGWTASDGYEVDWVPSMRMVVDLSNLDASRWVDLTGVSGHAFSPHYTDQVQRWATGESIPMRWSRTAVFAAATAHLTLRPDDR